MSEFVEACRREWARLGVPGPIASEMAADLEADLAEAAADGVSAEEVLGSGVFDPPSFAAAWASERGVVPPAPRQEAPGHATVETRRPRRSGLLIGLAVSACVAVIGLALLTAHTRVAQAVVSPSLGISPITGHLQLPPSIPRPRLGQVTIVRSEPGNAPFHTAGVIFLLVGAIGLIVSLARWLPALDRKWSHGAGST